MRTRGKEYEEGSKDGWELGKWVEGLDAWQ